MDAPTGSSPAIAAEEAVGSVRQALSGLFKRRGSNPTPVKSVALSASKGIAFPGTAASMGIAFPSFMDTEDDAEDSPSPIPSPMVPSPTGVTNSFVSNRRSL